jgi:hypothetical protein
MGKNFNLALTATPRPLAIDEQRENSGAVKPSRIAQ